MKTSSSELYDLIKTMSENERSGFIERYSQTSSSPDYLKLFKAYAAQKKFDEERIKKHLELKNFERIKIYLHKNLLSYLSMLSNEGVEQEIMNMISVGNVLAERLLVQQSLAIFKKARKLALKKEYLHYVLILDQKIHHHETGLLNQEHADHFRFKYKKEGFDPLIKRLEIELESEIYLLNRRLFSQKNSTLMRSKEARKELKNTFENYVKAGEHPLMTFNARIKFYIVSAYYYQQLNEFDKAIYFFQKSVYAFENENPNPTENYNNYAVAYHNLMFTYSRVKNLEGVRSVLDKLYVMKPRTKTHRTVIMQSYVTYESNYCKYVYDYALRKKRLAEIERYFLNNKTNIHKQLYLQTCINLSVNYFIDKKFKKALEILQHVSEYESMDYYKDMVNVMKVYRLIIYMEMEKMDLLSFAVRNTYRHMLKHMQYFEFEKVVIETLKRIILTNSVKEQNKILMNAADKFKDLKKSPDTAQVFLIFNFSGWIDCKVRNKEYYDLMNID